MKSCSMTQMASAASLSMDSRVQFSLRELRSFLGAALASGHSSTHSAPRFAANALAGGGAGGATISASDIVWASRYACTLADHMSRRFTHPPTGVPARSSGLALPVDRPVQEGSESPVCSTATTRPEISHMYWFSWLRRTCAHCMPKHACTSPTAVAAVRHTPRSDLVRRVHEQHRLVGVVVQLRRALVEPHLLARLVGKREERLLEERLLVHLFGSEPRNPIRCCGA